jgi:hypothetical protein
MDRTSPASLLMSNNSERKKVAKHAKSAKPNQGPQG